VPLQGLFDLRTPQDLLAKARHDFGRLKSSPLDQYAAFDFFVTARHIPEWVAGPGGDKGAALFERYIELRIARLIAEGAKHFEATDTRHKQVSATTVTPGAFQAGAFQTGGLVVALDPADSETSLLGTRIDALELARRVLAVLEKVVPLPPHPRRRARVMRDVGPVSSKEHVLKKLFNR